MRALILLFVLSLIAHARAAAVTQSPQIRESLENTCTCQCCRTVGSLDRFECDSTAATSFDVPSCSGCDVQACSNAFPVSCAQKSSVVEAQCITREGWMLRLVPLLFLIITAALLIYGIFFKKFNGYNDETQNRPPATSPIFTSRSVNYDTFNYRSSPPRPTSDDSNTRSASIPDYSSSDTRNASRERPITSLQTIPETERLTGSSPSVLDPIIPVDTPAPVSLTATQRVDEQHPSTLHRAYAQQISPVDVTSNVATDNTTSSLADSEQNPSVSAQPTVPSAPVETPTQVPSTPTRSLEQTSILKDSSVTRTTEQVTQPPTGETQASHVSHSIPDVPVTNIAAPHNVVRMARSPEENALRRSLTEQIVISPAELLSPDDVETVSAKHDSQSPQEQQKSQHRVHFDDEDEQPNLESHPEKDNEEMGDPVSSTVDENQEIDAPFGEVGNTDDRTSDPSVDVPGATSAREIETKGTSDLAVTEEQPAPSEPQGEANESETVDNVALQQQETIVEEVSTPSEVNLEKPEFSPEVVEYDSPQVEIETASGNQAQVDTPEDASTKIQDDAVASVEEVTGIEESNKFNDDIVVEAQTAEDSSLETTPSSLARVEDTEHENTTEDEENVQDSAIETKESEQESLQEREAFEEAEAEPIVLEQDVEDSPTHVEDETQVEETKETEDEPPLVFNDTAPTTEEAENPDSSIQGEDVGIEHSRDVPAEADAADPVTDDTVIASTDDIVADSTSTSNDNEQTEAAEESVEVDVTPLINTDDPTEPIEDEKQTEVSDLEKNVEEVTIEPEPIEVDSPPAAEDDVPITPVVEGGGEDIEDVSVPRDGELTADATPAIDIGTSAATEPADVNESVDIEESMEQLAAPSTSAEVDTEAEVLVEDDIQGDDAADVNDDVGESPKTGAEQSGPATVSDNPDPVSVEEGFEETADVSQTREIPATVPIVEKSMEETDVIDTEDADDGDTPVDGTEESDTTTAQENTDETGAENAKEEDVAATVNDNRDDVPTPEESDTTAVNKDDGDIPNEGNTEEENVTAAVEIDDAPLVEENNEEIVVVDDVDRTPPGESTNEDDTKAPTAIDVAESPVAEETAEKTDATTADGNEIVEAPTQRDIEESEAVGAVDDDTGATVVIETNDGATVDDEDSGVVPTDDGTSPIDDTAGVNEGVATGEEAETNTVDDASNDAEKASSEEADTSTGVSNDGSGAVEDGTREVDLSGMAHAGGEEVESTVAYSEYTGFAHTEIGTEYVDCLSRSGGSSAQNSAEGDTTSSGFDESCVTAAEKDGENVRTAGDEKADIDDKAEAEEESKEMGVEEGGTTMEEGGTDAEEATKESPIVDENAATLESVDIGVGETNLEGEQTAAIVTTSVSGLIGKADEHKVLTDENNGGGASVAEGVAV